MEKLADVRYATSVLQWDQETYLPAKGAAFRGRQISTLTELAHQMATSEQLGGLLQELQGRADLNPDEQRNVTLSHEDYIRQQKYPASFVRQLSDAINQAFHAWIDARRANSFSTFQPPLAALLVLKKQETDLLGFEGHPYNALLHEYEKGATVALLDRIFSDLLPHLKNLLAQIAARPQVDDHFLRRHFPKDKQWEWGLWLAGQLGYDFKAGRQDLSEHPFSISFNPHDVRITTRVDEQDFANMNWSTIHEVGHALYEQGLPHTAYGLPAGEACSYSIHESQSRLWENNVGRSAAFWQHYLPALRQYFGEQLADVAPDVFHAGINRVAPSLIRTEADEITYHLHVQIRYELEKKLIEGSLTAPDIPAFWNEQYRQQLGVQVPNDKQGCLQDVHWSHGSFGYFPTYSLGSFYAAQFYAAAEKAISGLSQSLAEGRLAPLLHWLRRQIHSRGRLPNSEALCREVTGRGLDVSLFMDYLLQKYTAIYNL